MNHSVKRLRQTTLFENFVRSKRGKTLDLMEAEVKTKTELRDILAAAAEKRIPNHETHKKEPDVVPHNVNNESCCSTSKTLESSLEDFSLTLSQTSDDLFPEEHFSDGTTSDNCDDTKAKRTFSWDQVPEVHLKRLPDCCPTLPPLKPTETHTIMFKLPIQSGICPEPIPNNYYDVWDSFHVKMPCSGENKCPVLQNGEKVIESRWSLIEKSLLQDITSSHDLQEAILQYNSQYASRWDFRGLHAFFKDVLKPEEKERFFEHTLPAMVRLALQLPHLCTHPVPLLRRQANRSVTFTQKQIACLLSNAFFCTFPRRNIQRKRNEQKFDYEYANYPDINFNRLYQGTQGKTNGILSRKAEKLKCLINYFARVTSEEPTGTVTFHRQCVQNLPKWSSSRQGIRKVVIDSYSVIEDGGFGMLQVDFANKFVGGGVLGNGSVQEEVRFVICPELIISRLFTECLGVSDVLLITGVEQFNKYSGYADSFMWDGDFKDQTPRDSWGRRCTKIVAMDALYYRKPVDQYRTALMQRELNKAYCGFYENGVPAEKLPAVATGNWGCGAYKGNSHLKFLIQLMAASENGRDMLYFTFRNSTLENEIKHMFELVSSRNVRVGDIWTLLCKYSETVLNLSKTDPPTFYDFFCKVFSAQSAANRSPQVSVSCGSSSTKSYENSDESTEELTDVEPVSHKEAG